MTEYGSPWRKKYEQTLETQTRREKELGDQIKALQQALLQISLAADGLDHQLDSALAELRRQLRKPLSGLPAVSLVSETAERFDSRRGERSELLLQAFETLAVQLLQLELPREVNTAVKAFRKSLKDRIGHLQRYPNILEELAQLQRQALASQRAIKPGFWQRVSEQLPEALTGHPETDRPTHEPAHSRSDDKPEVSADMGLAESVPVERVSDDEKGRVIDSDYDEIRGELGVTGGDHPEAIFERPRHEPAFSRISARITNVLTDLIEFVEPSPCVEQKMVAARRRIDRGLNWFELVPALEDIRDLVMQAYVAAKGDFSRFLESVNHELSDIYQTLADSAETGHQIHQTGVKLEQQLVIEVDTLAESVASAADLDQLKQEVNDRIGAIRDALSHFRQQQTAVGSPAVEQLGELAARVQSMDNQMRHSRVAFEELQRRALQDPLTELPNRPAYNERIHHELQRCQRYGHSLTLAVCDIDQYKWLNDNYGQQAGNKILKLIAGAISKRLRQVDFMARYGIDEFVILMPETGAETALKTLDKIRQALANTPFHFKADPVQVTVSIGIAAFVEEDTAETLFSRADRALNDCKNNGSNQCKLNGFSVVPDTNQSH